ncbi:MAG: helix-turn-helix transcriptional regulator [Halobacteriaceae archaeon]
MFDLNAFQRDILFTINGLDEPKGVDIKDELDKYYSEEISYGRLYPALDTLAEKGLVKINEVDGRTNSYTLTRRGKNEIQAREEWEQAHFQNQ